MLNENLNISKIKNYLFTSLQSVCVKRFTSMPTSIDNSWGKFMLIEVIKTSDDMMMGSAKVLITLWANQIGAGLEDAKTLEAMETTLLQLLKDHCITNDYSLYFSGGGYDVADYEKKISGRLYEIKVQVK